jgi:hypothetical protein
VESEGSRGDEEVEDGEKHRRTTGGSPSRTFFFPRNGRRFPPRTANPTSFFSPSPSTSAAAVDEDLGEESPVQLGFGRIPRQLLIGGG